MSTQKCDTAFHKRARMNNPLRSHLISPGSSPVLTTLKAKRRSLSERATLYSREMFLPSPQAGQRQKMPGNPHPHQKSHQFPPILVSLTVTSLKFAGTNCQQRDRQGLTLTPIPDTKRVRSEDPCSIVQSQAPLTPLWDPLSVTCSR